MKKLIAISLLATACASGVVAQNVVVTTSDGTAHKFAAERVKDITFTKIDNPDSDVTVFNSIEARGYSSGAIEATFSSESTNKTVTLWIVGPSMGKYLYDGSYTVTSEYGAMTIDSDVYSSYIMDGSVKQTLQSGTMNVSISGKVYTVTFDLTTTDGATLKGQWQGEMPGILGRDFTLATCEEPKVKTNDLDGRVDGEYYIKMNDSSWSYEMAMDFYAAAGTTALPAGTYTYSAESKTEGTFGPNSFLDLYSPSSSSRFVDGSTATISYDAANNINMVLNLVTDGGRKVDMTYNGAITFPPFDAPAITLATGAATTTWSSGKNATLEFATADNATKVVMDVYGASAPYLETGTYTFASDNTAMTVDLSDSWSYVQTGTTKTGFKSGTMTVNASGIEYTIVIDAVLTTGATFKAEYVGSMGKYGKDLVLTPTQPKLGSVTDQVAGEYYLKMNDADWTFEMAIDFFADPSTKRLPAGSYTFSNDKTPGTFSRVGYISFYSPSDTGYYADGSTVNVLYQGDNLVLDCRLNLENGRTVYLNYNGPHDFPAEDTKETITLATPTTPTIKDNNGRVDGEFYVKMNDSSWNYEMAVDFFADASAKSLPAGTYTYSTTGEAGTFGSKSYVDLYTPNLGSCKFAEGSTATVAYDGDNIVLSFNFVIDGKDYIVKMDYTGAINSELPAEDTKETIILATPTTPTIKDNNGRVNGEFYVKMNDSSWNYEMAVDFFADASATSLPAGTYTYSTTGEAGTFGSKSYVDLYTPNLGSCKFAEGSTATVAYDGDNIVLSFNFVIDGKDYIVKMDYTGPISSEL